MADRHSLAISNVQFPTRSANTQFDEYPAMRVVWHLLSFPPKLIAQWLMPLVSCNLRRTCIVSNEKDKRASMAIECM